VGTTRVVGRRQRHQAKERSIVETAAGCKHSPQVLHNVVRVLVLVRPHIVFHAGTQRPVHGGLALLAATAAAWRPAPTSAAHERRRG
jgi:hypothetical protein